MALTAYYAPDQRLEAMLSYLSGFAGADRQTRQDQARINFENQQAVFGGAGQGITDALQSIMGEQQAGRMAGQEQARSLERIGAQGDIQGGLQAQAQQARLHSQAVTTYQQQHGFLPWEAAGQAPLQTPGLTGYEVDRAGQAVPGASGVPYSPDVEGPPGPKMPLPASNPAMTSEYRKAKQRYMSLQSAASIIQMDPNMPPGDRAKQLAALAPQINAAAQILKRYPPPKQPTMQELVQGQTWTDPETGIVYSPKDMKLTLPSKADTDNIYANMSPPEQQQYRENALGGKDKLAAYEAAGGTVVVQQNGDVEKWDSPSAKGAMSAKDIAKEAREQLKDQFQVEGYFPAGFNYLEEYDKAVARLGGTTQPGGGGAISLDVLRAEGADLLLRSRKGEDVAAKAASFMAAWDQVDDATIAAHPEKALILDTMFGVLDVLEGPGAPVPEPMPGPLPDVAIAEPGSVVRSPLPVAATTGEGVSDIMLRYRPGLSTDTFLDRGKALVRQSLQGEKVGKDIQSLLDEWGYSHVPREYPESKAIQEMLDRLNLMVQSGRFGGSRPSGIQQRGAHQVVPRAGWGN